jgi:hypothetical protein
MKVEVKEVKKSKFPKLVKSKESGNVYLAISSIQVTCLIVKNGAWGVGEHNTDMSGVDFEDFNGTITLQND